MEVTCQNCGAKLNIPDQKIPENRAVRIACPKCKTKIALQPKNAPTRAEENGPTGEYPLRFIESKKKSKEEEGYGYDEYSGDETLDFFEEGAKVALVLIPTDEMRDKVKMAVEKLGYQCIFSSDTRDATGKMRFHHFDLIMISDGFDGEEVETSPILHYLNRISMSVRRRIFLALFSDKFKTMDNMMAFSLSANVVINPKDMKKLQPILKKAISDHEKFYKIFMDTMAEVGKA